VSATTCFETLLASSALITLVISLLNGRKTISLALIAFFQGGNKLLIVVSVHFALVKSVFNAGSLIVTFDGL
jgi:hypothetical protein